MDKDKAFENRMTELNNRAYERGYTVFSDFLSIDEISTLKTILPYGKYSLYGGYNDAERCIAAFSQYKENNEAFPVKCIKIVPINKKFADNLTHRDYLGAVMNLSVDRAKTGDIVLTENSAFLFCAESICEYIAKSLKRVKHTNVKCEIVPTGAEIVKSEPLDKTLSVSSLRADAVICAVFNLTRNAATQCFADRKVFINSKVAARESVVLKDGDKVTVRGRGKFIFVSQTGVTKKGKILAAVKIY